MPERIQKVLARAGVGSRRAVEGWIEAGRIQVNGAPASLGDRIDADDSVLLDGKPVKLDWRAEPRFKLLAYYKPEGEICTRSDPEGRKNVFDQLPRLKQGRWVALGRLDINSQGLMLFTTDGELANRLLHPSAGIEREYAVRSRGQLSREAIARLIAGVELDDGPARCNAVRDGGGEGSNHWYHVVLHEGRRNEVRRLWEAVGCQVARLTRVRFGPVTLPRSLQRDKFEDLPPADIRAMLDLLPAEHKPGHGEELRLEPWQGRRTPPPSKKKTAARGKAGARKTKPAGRTTAGPGATKPSSGRAKKAASPRRRRS